MTRASGRRNPTRPSTAGDPGPGSPQGLEIGESATQDPAGSPIPGLTGNIVNHETPRRQVDAPEPMDQFRGMMAHGVPHEQDTTEERATAERGGPNAPRARPPATVKRQPEPPPVPVYIVERDSGPSPLSPAALNRVTVPGIGGDPVRLAGDDSRRSLVQLMNEDPANNVRMGPLVDLIVDEMNGVITGGARLPAGASGYTALRTQAALFALGESADPVTVSVILEYEIP